MISQNQVPNTRHLQPKHIFEVLTVINESPDDLTRIEKLHQYCNKPIFQMLFTAAFSSKPIFDLPEGEPPFKRDEQTHPDFFTPLSTMIEKLKICSMNSKSPRLAKERVFIEMLESIPPNDADVLLAVKDRNLNELYPNISLRLVKAAFPALAFK